MNMKPLVALAGRPNTGKTTLFNALTGLRQRVANFAGCTVEKAVGILEREEASLEIVDLPGTFSILPSSSDEEVALRFLGEAAADGADLRVLCLAEASNLQNDLALALSLQDCGLRVGLVVNMMDEAALNGIELDGEILEAEIGMPVHLACAREGKGIKAISNALARPAAGGRGPQFDLRRASRQTLLAVHESAVARARAAASRALRLPRKALLPTIARSIRIDRWLFDPLAGPLILAAAMFSVFQALFALGAPLRDAIAGDLASLSAALRPTIPSELLASLVCDGIIAGVSAVATFIPQIAILFALIGLLEQSGYLPRAGAMVDRALRPFGLDGRVFIPFLSSFACAIPGVMATRTIGSEKRRLVAILLSPLMTCSARIPVYTLIIAAFVPDSWRVLGFNGQGVVMAAMYALGIAAALALALVLRRTPLYEAHPSPVTVLPPYRLPSAQELGRYVWLRCWHFLSKAGKVIFVVSLVLWALASFPRSEEAGAALRAEIVELGARQDRSPEAEGRLSELQGRLGAVQIENSLLGRLGRGVEPVFAPVGFDWKVSIAVISSLAAREVFVGTLGTLFALSGEARPSEGLIEALRGAKTPEGRPRYGLPTAVSLLLFFAIALQCVSTIVIVRRETGSWKWPALQFSAFFAIAYALAYAGYHLTGAFIH